MSRYSFVSLMTKVCSGLVFFCQPVIKAPVFGYIVALALFYIIYEWFLQDHGDVRRISGLNFHYSSILFTRCFSQMSKSENASLKFIDISKSRGKKMIILVLQVTFIATCLEIYCTFRPRSRNFVRHAAASSQMSPKGSPDSTTVVEISIHVVGDLLYCHICQVIFTKS